MLRRWHTHGFSLVELMVVVAVISILIALLLPAVGAMRDTARTTKCANNLHNVVTALHAAKNDDIQVRAPDIQAVLGPYTETRQPKWLRGNGVDGALQNWYVITPAGERKPWGGPCSALRSALPACRLMHCTKPTTPREATALQIPCVRWIRDMR